MADRADVVPLRPRAPEFPEPAVRVADVADPARALTLSWSVDQGATRLAIEGADGRPGEVVLDADDVLLLVRALIERLPGPAASCTRPLATVIPLRPLGPQEFRFDP